MSGSHYFGVCQRGIGRAVEIRCRNGRVHRGIIDKVTPNRVFLRPFGGRAGLGGYGYAGYGYGAWGFGAGIALGTIAALAFIPFYF